MGRASWGFVWGNFLRAVIFHTQNLVGTEEMHSIMVEGFVWGECNTGGIARIPMQDYKCLCMAVVITAILVNTQTHIHTQTDSFQPVT